MEINIFQYSHGKSFLHKTNSLLKLILLCGISLFLFMCPKNLEMLGSVFFAIISLVLFFIIKQKIKDLKFFLFVFYFSIFVTFVKIINVSFEPSFNIIIDFSQIKSSFVYILKLFATIMFSNLFLTTTSSFSLLVSLDKIPFFKKLKFSVYICITLRFIPMCFETFEKVFMTLKVRSGTEKNIFVLLKNFSLCFVTIFSVLLKKSYDTCLALQNRLFIE
ncbi:MAG: energy-coupling factor transporter transmembrane protein EcfT [Treponema sp.]|nr:energy-coupling factor transporter transmembrane protein EcfT [Treponema sp.]